MEKNSVEGKAWTDIIEAPEKRTVGGVMEGPLKKRDNGEKERLSRRRNIIIFELPESKKPGPGYGKEKNGISRSS